MNNNINMAMIYLYIITTISFISLISYYLFTFIFKVQTSITIDILSTMAIISLVTLVLGFLIWVSITIHSLSKVIKSNK